MAKDKSIKLIFAAIFILHSFVFIDKINGAINTEYLRKIIEEKNSEYDPKSAFSSSRNVYERGNDTKMQEYIKYKFGKILGMAGGADKNHKFYSTDFLTSFKINKNTHNRLSAKNLIAFLSQDESFKKENDKPLIIVANYDTDVLKKDLNYVEDNGSGVAVLIAIGERISSRINKGLKLKHSIILAAIDASLQKYSEDGTPKNATSGDFHLVNTFLKEEVLKERDTGIRGAIVLDNLFNFNTNKSSVIYPDSISKTYPKAYEAIAEGEFKGDFLALVGRDTDSELTKAIEESWESSRKEERLENTASNARLIKFIHDINAFQGDIYHYFLQSAQTSFWAHPEDTSRPSYPAILLTDMRKFRSPICQYCDSNIRYDATLSDESLTFAHRTVKTVLDTALKLQSGAIMNVSGFLVTFQIVLFTIRQFWT